MQGCKDICPVLKIQKCCFLCDRISTCDQRCSEESNSLCELLIDIPDGNCEQLAEPILQKLELILKQKAELEAKEKELKEALKALMEEHKESGLKSNKHMKVTYIAASSSVVFDTDLFRKTEPTVYAKYCVKPKETKAYIKCELLRKVENKDEQG